MLRTPLIVVHRQRRLNYRKHCLALEGKRSACIGTHRRRAAVNEAIFCLEFGRFVRQLSKSIRKVGFLSWKGAFQVPLFRTRNRFNFKQKQKIGDFGIKSISPKSALKLQLQNCKAVLDGGEEVVLSVAVAARVVIAFLRL